MITYGHHNETGLGGAYYRNLLCLRELVPVTLGSLSSPTPSDEPIYLHTYKTEFAKFPVVPDDSILYIVCEGTTGVSNYTTFASKFSQIWTASTYCAEIFSTAFGRPVSVVPHGLESFRMSLPARPSRPYTFGCFVDFHSRVERKNPWAAIQAFRDAFTRDNPNVHFLLKVQNASASFIRAAKQVLGSQITVLSGFQSKYQIPFLWDSIDAYVSPHGSEGFGLHLLEAQANGVLVIATDFSGNTDFCNQDNSCPISCSLEPAWDSHYKGSIWGRVSQDHLITLFREATQGKHEQRRLTGFETCRQLGLPEIKEVMRGLL